MKDTARKALKLHIERSMAMPFEWGKNDCLSFADKAVEIQRGHGFVTEWLNSGYYNARTAAIHYGRHLRDTGYKSVLDVADERLERIDTLQPEFGDIVARKTEGGAISWAFGVATSKGVAFLDESGARLCESELDDVVWRVT